MPPALIVPTGRIIWMSGCQAGKYKAVRNKTQMQTIGQTETVQELIHKMNAHKLTVMGKKREKRTEEFRGKQEGGRGKCAGRQMGTDRFQDSGCKCSGFRFVGSGGSRYKGAKQH